MEGALSADDAMMKVSELFADGESDAGAGYFGGIRAAIKLSKDEVNIRFGNADAGVLYGENNKLMGGGKFE